jgi:hypothetical protein
MSVDKVVSAVISEQMNENRPLPTNRTEWDEWSERIMAGALVGATREDQLFALADLIMRLGPTEDHKPDIFFIKSLRKSCVNQVAEDMRKELHAAKKAKTGATAKGSP